MVIETGCKIFDRQTNCISTGNIYASTMTGRFVRCHGQRTCFGPEVHKPGYLQEWDLQKFEHMPQWIRNKVRQLGRRRTLQVYEFFHSHMGRRLIHGYVVADKHNRFLGRYFVGDSWKSYSVIMECEQWVSKVQPTKSTDQMFAEVIQGTTAANSS